MMRKTSAGFAAIVFVFGQLETGAEVPTNRLEVSGEAYLNVTQILDGEGNVNGIEVIQASIDVSANLPNAYLPVASKAGVTSSWNDPSAWDGAVLPIVNAVKVTASLPGGGLLPVTAAAQVLDTIEGYGPNNSSIPVPSLEYQIANLSPGFSLNTGLAVPLKFNVTITERSTILINSIEPEINSLSIEEGAVLRSDVFRGKVNVNTSLENRGQLENLSVAVEGKLTNYNSGSFSSLGTSRFEGAIQNEGVMNLYHTNTILGEITNSGTMLIDRTVIMTDVTPQPKGSVHNTGELTLGHSAFISGPSAFKNEGSMLLQGEAFIDGAVKNTGTIVTRGALIRDLENRGRVDIDSSNTVMNRLDNFGTITNSGTNTSVLFNGNPFGNRDDSIFLNHVGATHNLEGFSVTFGGIGISYEGLGRYVNEGIVNANDSIVTTTSAISFINRGRINAGGGTLDFKGGYRQEGGVLDLSGTELKGRFIEISGGLVLGHGSIRNHAEIRGSIVSELIAQAPETLPALARVASFAAPVIPFGLEFHDGLSLLDGAKIDVSGDFATIRVFGGLVRGSASRKGVNVRFLDGFSNLTSEFMLFRFEEGVVFESFDTSDFNWTGLKYGFAPDFTFRNGGLWVEIHRAEGPPPPPAAVPDSGPYLALAALSVTALFVISRRKPC